MKLMPVPVNNTSQGLIVMYKGYLCIYNGVQKSETTPKILHKHVERKELLNK